MEAAYWFSSAGDYDGMVVWLLPNDQAAEALNFAQVSKVQVYLVLAAGDNVQNLSLFQD